MEPNKLRWLRLRSHTFGFNICVRVFFSFFSPPPPPRRHIPPPHLHRTSRPACPTPRRRPADAPPQRPSPVSADLPSSGGVRSSSSSSSSSRRRSWWTTAAVSLADPPRHRSLSVAGAPARTRTHTHTNAPRSIQFKPPPLDSSVANHPSITDRLHDTSIPCVPPLSPRVRR